MKDKIKNLRNCVAILTIILIGILFIVIGFNSKLNIYAPRGMGAVDYNEYMKITNYTRTVVEDENAPIGKVIDYRFYVPYTISMDNSIMFYVYHHDVEIHIEDELVYNMTLEKSFGVGKSTACEWVCVPTSKQDMGKEVLIRLKPVYNSVEGSEMDFFYGNEGVILANVAKKEIPNMLIASICVFFGVIMIVAKIIFHKKVSYYPKETTYLGMLAVILGIWKIYDSELAPLLLNVNPIILGNIPLVALFLCMIPITAYVGNRFDETDTVKFFVGSLALWILPANVLIQQLLNIADLRENLYLSHLAMIIVAIMALRKIIIEKRNGKTANNLGNPLLLLLCIGVVIDVIIFYVNNATTSMVFSMLGFLIYSMGMFMNLIFDAIDDGKRLETLVEERTSDLQESLEKAEAGAKAKENFLFNMSHDIRTPMNAVLGFNEIAKENIDDKEKVLDALEKSKFSGEYMLSIINDILDMSLIESGKMKLNREVMDVNKTLLKIVNQFTKESESRNIEFEVINNANPRRAYGDVLRMTQIFTNLIGNAFKFTPAGGKVTLTIDEEKVGDTRVKYIFHIIDTGVGISPEFQETIFNAFEREKSATESGVRGTGLGLAIVKNIVDVMEGEIFVKSEVGKGSDFCVKLYAEVVDDIFELESKEEKSFIGIGKKVLLVEDNMLNREIARELLMQEGFLVEEAENGKVACDMIQNNKGIKYDVVLMDIQMPVMDGYEAAKIIRSLEDPTLANVPIVAMTANTFAEDRKKSLDVGMDEHVSKPIDKGLLMSVLSNILL